MDAITKWDGWMDIGWLSLGGVRYGAPYSTNNMGLLWKHLYSYLSYLRLCAICIC